MSRSRRGACALALGLLASSMAPHPAQAQPNPGWIRVAVAKGDPQVVLQIFGPFEMFALRNGDRIHEGPRLLSVPVRGVPQGLVLGREVIPHAGVRIEPSRDAAISLNGKRLRGTLEIVRQKDLTLLVINHVALEDYLRGVLSKEAPDYWPVEALKAIAIAARTYALYQRFAKQAGEYDVTGDVMSQDYGGRGSEKVGTTRAVKATDGLVVLYGDQLFPPFYHSTCGGMTEHARVMGSYDLRPLRGGIVCRFCSASPFFSWRRRLTRADVNWALHQSPHGTIGAIRDIAVTKRSGSGRAQEILIRGARRGLKLTGYEFRALFGFDRIRSPLFSVIDTEDGFVLDGHGWGHGVGLCQWGAAELARRGLSAAEILAYYYPGVQLISVADLAKRPITVVQGGV